MDLCVVSRTMVNAITSFSANQDLNIASDHAPMSVSFDSNNVKSNIDLTLIERSSLLGAYPVHEKDGLCRKPIPYHSVDNELFFTHMQQLQPPEVNHNNITESVEVLTETLYNVSSVCNVKLPQSTYSNANRQNSRWERMLEVEDTKLLWRGINWNGEYRESESKERPPEEAFQQHMERLLNPDNIDPIERPDINEQVPYPYWTIRSHSVSCTTW